MPSNSGPTEGRKLTSSAMRGTWALSVLFSNGSQRDGEGETVSRHDALAADHLCLQGIISARVTKSAQRTKEL